MKELRDYQQDAVEAAVKALGDTGGRGQIYAACGSGKTITAIACADRLVPGSGVVAVLVPTLALVAQTIATWRADTRMDAILAVCSDGTVADDADAGSIEADVTTDPEAVRTWWAGPGRRLLVGTYASAARVADALDGTGDTIDLLILDEAHHLAGDADMVSAKVLDDRHLPALRRLAFTATPRINDAAAQTTGALTMSDTTLFGPVLHEYAWGAAIRDGHLKDYRLVVIGITGEQMRDLLVDPDRDYADAVGAPSLRLMAAQAVAAKAARAYGLRRILAFTHRVEAAAEFTRTMGRVVSRLPAEQRPDLPLDAAYVHGGMDHRERHAVLERLRHPQGWCVVANCRCLSEGVDVPAIDAILFTHPKSSQVDIVQAAGRAMRRSADGPQTATMIVPIVVPDSAEEISDLDPGEFRVLWQVVRALRAHDETWGIDVDGQSFHMSTSNPRPPDRITVLVPQQTAQGVLDALTARVVKAVVSPWWDSYQQARVYREENGHLDAPSSYRTPDGHALGVWLQNARMHRRKGWLSPRRIRALDDLGMNWEPRLNQWQRLLERLRMFHTEHGHLQVPQAYQAGDGYPLGSRVNTLRSNTGRIPRQFRRDLDALGMVWDTRDLRWQEFYSHCRAYAQAHGHLRVPHDHLAGDGYPLGLRMKAFAKKVRANTADQQELHSLAELGFELPPLPPWERFLAECDRYIAEHGALASLSLPYTTPGGYRLGKVAADYRAQAAGSRTNVSMPAQRRAELEARGFRWRAGPEPRDISAGEARELCDAADSDRADLVVRLLEEEQVTQSSIAAVLGINPSALYERVKRFRETGQWSPLRVRSSGGASRSLTRQEAVDLRALGTAEQAEYAVRLFDAGVTAKSLGEALGVSGNTVRSRIEKYRTDRVWPREAPRTRMITAREAEELIEFDGDALAARIVTLVDAGVTQTSIAAAVGMNAPTLAARVRVFRASGVWTVKKKGRRIKEEEVQALRALDGADQADQVLALLDAGVSANSIGEVLGTYGQFLRDRADAYRNGGQWRLQALPKPRAITDAEAAALRAAHGQEQGALAAALIDSGGAVKAVAEMMGISRPSLTSALTTYRAEGRWPARGADRNITAAQIQTLLSHGPAEQAVYVLHLLDDEHITRASIAQALQIPHWRLREAVKRYRINESWSL